MVSTFWVIRRARKASGVMKCTEKKRAVVSRTVVEVSNNVHISASGSMNPGRRARHAETLIDGYYGSLHFLLLAWNNHSFSTERILQQDICYAILITLPRLPEEEQTRSSPGLCAVAVYREQTINTSNSIANSSIKGSSRSQFWPKSALCSGQS